MGIKTIKVRLWDNVLGISHYILITINKGSIDVEAFDDEKEAVHSHYFNFIGACKDFDVYEKDLYTKAVVKNGKARTHFNFVIPQYLFMFSGDCHYIIDLYHELFA